MLYGARDALAPRTELLRALPRLLLSPISSAMAFLMRTCYKRSLTVTDLSSRARRHAATSSRVTGFRRDDDAPLEGRESLECITNHLDFGSGVLIPEQHLARVAGQFDT